VLLANNFIADLSHVSIEICNILKYIAIYWKAKESWQTCQRTNTNTYIKCTIIYILSFTSGLKQMKGHFVESVSLLSQ